MNAKLSIMSLLSFALSGIYVFSNLFYSFTLFIIGFVFIWGVFKNKNIWYHSSAHLVVGTIMGVVLAFYELIYFLSNILVFFMENTDFPSIEYFVILFGIFSYILFKIELHHLKERKNQIN
ncbi:MAG: hypothetical protein ACQESN_03315 [Thermotogota bacterium]